VQSHLKLSAYCEIPLEKVWSRITQCSSWLCLRFHPLKKVNVIADYLENLFTPHDLCEETHEWLVEARFQALLESIDDSPPQRANVTYKN
jgi:hypothetical protein